MFLRVKLPNDLGDKRALRWAVLVLETGCEAVVD